MVARFLLRNGVLLCRRYPLNFAAPQYKLRTEDVYRQTYSRKARANHESAACSSGAAFFSGGLGCAEPGGGAATAELPGETWRRERGPAHGDVQPAVSFLLGR